MKTMTFMFLLSLCLNGCATYSTMGAADPTGGSPHGAVTRGTNYEKSIAERKLVISIAEQRMALLENGRVKRTFLISTSRFGIGEIVDSGGTPRGRHAVADKIGAGMPVGTVFEDRKPTKEIVEVDAPGRSPVITRIIRLRGLEARNQTTLERWIYLHGSPVESLLGTPASGGCIRLSSKDVLYLFDLLDEGIEVNIHEETLDEAIDLIKERDDKVAQIARLASAGDAPALRTMCIGSYMGTSDFPIDYSVAHQSCEKSAATGNAIAQNLLGLMFEKGQGVAQNEAEANRYFLLAAKRGHAHAQYKLALMYRDGNTVPQSAQMMAYYLALSAKQNHPSAIHMLRQIEREQSVSAIERLTIRMN